MQQHQKQTGADQQNPAASEQHRMSRDEALAIKAEVDYQRLNKSFTDVTFIVGPAQHSKKYVGHRVLLAMTSPVFEAMFYGDMADKSKYIRVSDVAPIGFENLLRFAYTDSLKLSSVEDAMLTAYAAKKYLLPQLLRECLTYIELNISPATACVVFEFAHVLNSQQLVLQAINLIDRQATNVINNKSFNHVQASTVEFVANRKYLNLNSEYNLFNSIINWALAEAKRRQLITNETNPIDWLLIRSILNENSCFNAIRFLSMSPEEFAKLIVKTSSHVETLYNSPNSDDSFKVGHHQPQNVDDKSLSTLNQVNVEDSNSLLSDAEQKAIFLNLTLANVAKLPNGINSSQEARQAPPEYFTLKRFRLNGSNFLTTSTTTRNIKTIGNATSYINRTPKFECHLKFSTKMNSPSSGDIHNQNDDLNQTSMTPTTNKSDQSNEFTSSSTLLMDTIDESLHISIARDRDCLIRLKRPILIRIGHINELTLTFQTYALDEDIVELRAPKLRSTNFSEQTDEENISWLFFKTSHTEFSELHYYY